eukprot:208232_1
MKPFLCFNCKVRIPRFGDTKWEMVLTTVTLLLFVLSFVEIVALAQFSKAFSTGTADGCCGVIEENSWPAAGHICHEDDIIDSKIEKQIIDGSIFCVVGDEVCDEFSFEHQGNATDLEACLSLGQYPLTDICSQELIQKDLTYKTAETAAACICLCIIIFSVTVYGVSEYIGCFDDSKWCQSQIVQVLNKLLEICTWIVLLVISQIMIENTAFNGYRAERPPNSAARHFLYDTCEIENKSILWIDFELTVPEWLQSAGYQSLAMIGVGLSIIEFALYFVVFHQRRIKTLEEKKKGGVQTTIEMGDKDTKDGDGTATKDDGDGTNKETLLQTADDGDKTGQTDEDVIYNNDDEKEVEYVTAGGPDGEDIEDDDNKEDGDVIYDDDDEKEAEYVTAGGPDGED